MNGLCEVLALELIETDCAAHVLHHFSGEGHAPGAFFGHVINAFAVADPRNEEFLGRGFPQYRLAVHLAQDHRLGMDTLRAIAMKEKV